MDSRSNTRWLPRLLSHARFHSPSTVDTSASASPPPLIDTVPIGGPAITVTAVSLPFPLDATEDCSPARFHPKSSNPCPCSLTTAPANIINPVTTIHITEPLLPYE